MEIKEAIEALKLINLKSVHPFLSWEEMMEVRDMAIIALQEKEKRDRNPSGLSLACRCKLGYKINEDGTIPQRCHVDWDDSFYPTLCKECPFYNSEY